MKKTILLAVILFHGLFIVAQTLSGTYMNGTDSLIFSNEQVDFRITGFAGLSTAQVGEGSYDIVDNFLLVNTNEYSGDKTTFKELDGSKTDTCVVKVVGLNNYAIQGVLIETKSKSNKTISAGVTGNDGVVLFLDDDKCESLTISMMGYNSIEFDYTKGKDYLIRLAEHEVIEDKTVVFRFKELDEETISILLLTDDLNSGKNRDSELNKLEKRARKNNRIEKLYKKKFEPFVGIY